MWSWSFKEENMHDPGWDANGSPTTEAPVKTESGNEPAWVAHLRRTGRAEQPTKKEEPN